MPKCILSIIFCMLFDYGGGNGVPGKVFIYAGNAQLVDPIHDETDTPAISRMKLFPNPLQPQLSNLDMMFTPLPPSSRGVISPTFEIYNIRGQKVKSFTISAEQTKSGSATYNLNDRSSGVYICVFSRGEIQHKGNITIIH